MANLHSWWQTGVIYQIYPRSFMDGNGDGIGDLAGIISHLDYLQWLGVNALWLSPIYPSPMADFGYDISDYKNIHPLFGSLDDIDRLIAEAHQRELKVILDYVPNHTSDEHEWFKESRSSRSNAKRDWYIWRDPTADGGLPNNWTSFFGGPAWQFDEQTGQYYLHLFDVKQPDLNWRNPAVRQAMYDVLHFWLQRGIDGFRVDVLWMMIKDDQFRDNVMNPNWKPGDRHERRQEGTYTQDQPGIHEVVSEIRSVIDEYPDRVFIGEIYLPIPRLVQYYGVNLDEAHLPFNFQFILMENWTASTIQTGVETYEAALPQGAWPNWVMGNHDRPRIVTRVGREQARVAQMLLLTLRGTPTMYYGDELGMQNGNVPRELMHDPEGKDNPANSRDPERTPMQWDSSPNAGFSPPDSTLWLPITDDYKLYNVETEKQQADSYLSLTRTLLALRRKSPALTIGTYQTVTQENKECFVYLRETQQQRYLIVLNCTGEEQIVNLPPGMQGKIVVSTGLDREDMVDLAELHLRANEGFVIELDSVSR
jgi:alpha-glucosidase